MAIELTLDELIEHAKPLGQRIHKVDDRHVWIEGHPTMNKDQFRGWIARTRVAQSLRGAERF